MKILLAIAIFPIKLYQLFISPFIGSNCRYQPTCSEYTTEALKTHGLFYGGWLSICRIIKCNPLGSHGFDPVPKKSSR